MDSSPTIDNVRSLVPGLVKLGASAVELMVAPGAHRGRSGLCGNAVLLEKP